MSYLLPTFLISTFCASYVETEITIEESYAGNSYVFTQIYQEISETYDLDELGVSISSPNLHLGIDSYIGGSLTKPLPYHLKIVYKKIYTTDENVSA